MAKLDKKPTLLKKSSIKVHPRIRTSDPLVEKVPALQKDDKPPAQGRNDLKPKLLIEEAPLSALKRPARNVRRADKKQIERVKASIKKFGIVGPILINRALQIIDGNILFEAARALKLDTVPCIKIDHLSKLEIRQLRVTLNKLQETGDWDFDTLRLEFEDFLEINTDLEFSGFEIAEIDQILETGVDGQSELLEDSLPLPELEEEAVTELGDLWRLGDHRLLCGNSLSPRDVQNLCGGAKVQMLYTDPPYNVPINGHVRGAGAQDYREFAMASGEMTKEEFQNFLTNGLKLAAEVLNSGAMAYVFMDWRHIGEMSSAIEAAGFKLVNLCVWVKPNGGMGSLYRSRHELVFVLSLGSGKTRNNVQLGKHGRNRTNVWEYADATGGKALPEDDFTLHPTVKPIQMASEAILDVTAINDIVLDLFHGSGSTLLAAEKTRRRCYAMELDPAYVDLAIRRWQDMTGNLATHDETGEPFDALAKAKTLENNDDRPQSKTKSILLKRKPKARRQTNGKEK